MTGAPDVASYRVIRRLDDARPAWLAEDPTGVRHALRFAEVDDGDYDSGEYGAAWPAHHHILRVEELARDAGGRPVVVTEHAAGGSLARLLALRGALPPGEAVTIVAPVARALSALHGAGLLHGEVELSAVYLRESGQPVISVPGRRTAARGVPGEAGRREDVRAAALICWRLIAGDAAGPGAGAPGPGVLTPLRYLVPEVSPALNLLIARALDPGTPLSAEELADGLLLSTPPLPVRLMAGTDRYQDPAGALTEVIMTRGPGGERARRAERSREQGRRGKPGLMRKPGLTGKPGREKRSRGRTHRGSRPAGRRRPAAVAAVGLLVAVLGGVLLFGTHDAGPVKRGSELQVSEPLDRSEPPAPATSEPDPAAALADLSRVRERLFRTLDAGLMPALSVEGSPARRADENMVARLREEGATLKGLSVEVDGARTLERSGDGAVARVRASAGASAYREVTSSGSTVRPAAEPAPLDFELHRVGGRWLVYAVYPASA